MALRVGEQSLIGAFRERVTARPGEVLPISPDPDLVHLFDRKTGRRIGAGQPA